MLIADGTSLKDQHQKRSVLCTVLVWPWVRELGVGVANIDLLAARRRRPVARERMTRTVILQVVLVLIKVGVDGFQTVSKEMTEREKAIFLSPGMILQATMRRYVVAILDSLLLRTLQKNSPATLILLQL
ncbi:MAG: hypothetical protein Q9186_006444 [Xanthomendoza sp. 1 TL-2023]